MITSNAQVFIICVIYKLFLLRSKSAKIYAGLRGLSGRHMSAKTLLKTLSKVLGTPLTMIL